MRTKYLIEINYKSGIQKQFWVYDFKAKNGTWTWTSVHEDNKPVIMNVDEVESVWQIGYKRWGFI